MNCPRNEAHDQSSAAATTTMMVVNVMFSQQHRQMESQFGFRIQEMLTTYAETMRCSTYVACEGLVQGTVRCRMADGRSMMVTEVRHVPSLRKI